MKTKLTFLFFLLMYFNAFSQESEKVNYLLKDVDFDKVNDTIYIDKKKSVVVCKLSSQNFKKMESKPIEILNETSGIKATKNGFEFFNDWMRAGFKNQFRYNKKTKKIQLIGMGRYEFGPASNDGSGSSSVNLLTNDYIGKWNYYDEAADELLPIPPIKTKLPLGVFNLEDFGEDTYFGYSEKCSELFHKFKDIERAKKKSPQPSSRKNPHRKDYLIF